MVTVILSLVHPVLEDINSTSVSFKSGIATVSPPDVLFPDVLPPDVFFPR